MTRETIFSQFRKILTDDFEVPAENIKPQAELRRDLGLDSLDLVDFLMLVQKDMNYHAPLSDYKEVADLDALATLVLARMQKR